MSFIGYGRVSTAECRQVPDRQLDALNAAGLERVFENHVFRRRVRAPKPGRLPRLPAEGDVLVDLDLGRLGRRAGDLTGLIDELDQRGVGFRAFNSVKDSTAHNDKRG